MDRKVITILFFTFMLMGCYDSFDSFVPNITDELAKESNATIQDLHTKYSAGVREITEEIIVEGTVTANDEHGNFFKSVIIENEGYALEILDGLYDSYVRYPIGSKLIVRLNGLGMDRYREVLRVGLVAPSTSSYSLDYIGAEALLDQYILLTGYGESLAAQKRYIAELEQGRAGELIRISSLHLHTEDGVERNWEGYALFRDTNLDSIWCYTTSYADFAKFKIPQQEVELSGILKYGSTDELTDQFIIQLRNEEDCIY